MSLILLLPYEGSIKIDGIEARNIPRDRFKTIFTIIPELPVVFPSASIRQNLLTDEIMDPSLADAILNPDGILFLFDNDMDERLTVITKLLRGVGLLDIVRDAGGVDAKFSNLVLSPTQRQKFSLAQGLAKYYATRTKMTIIDSTTSHVNTEGLERMNSLIDEVLGAVSDCMVITTASNSDAIEGSQYVARITGGTVLKFFVEAMLDRNYSESNNRVSKRPQRTQATMNEEDLTADLIRQQRQRNRDRMARSPSPGGVPLNPPDLTAAAVPSASVPFAMETYRRISHSPGSGRDLVLVTGSRSFDIRPIGPPRRRRGRTTWLYRQVPVSPMSEDCDEYTEQEQGDIPTWMEEFQDNSIGELRKQELYARIFEFGSPRMQTLLSHHRARDVMALMEEQQREQSDDPAVMRRHAEESQALLAYHRNMEMAVQAARSARQRGLI